MTGLSLLKPPAPHIGEWRPKDQEILIGKMKQAYYTLESIIPR